MGYADAIRLFAVLLAVSAGVLLISSTGICTQIRQTAVDAHAGAFLSPKRVARSGQVTSGPRRSLADAGDISGNLYTNKILGLSYEFPRGWSVDKAAMDYENAPPRGPEPQDPVQKRIFHLKDSAQLLLEVSQHPADTPQVVGPRIMFGASVFSSGEKDPRGEMVKFMQKTASALGDRITRGPFECSFAGQTFSRMDTARDFLPPTPHVYSSYIVGVRDGYRLYFELSADTPQQLGELVETLNSLQFHGLR